MSAQHYQRDKRPYHHELGIDHEQEARPDHNVGFAAPNAVAGSQKRRKRRQR